MTAERMPQRREKVVLFLTPTMGVGGAERQYYLLMRALRGTGWVPRLVSLNERGRFFEASQESGIDSIFLNVPTRNFLRGAYLVRALMKSPDVEVVLARGFSATTLVRLAALTLRYAPVVVVAEHSSGRTPSRKWYHDVVDRMLAPLTSVFVAVAHSQVPYLVNEKRLDSDLIEVIHNGIEYGLYLNADRSAARVKLGIGAQEFVVGIVAALRPEKDHMTFLRAAAKLSTLGAECRFLIVGDGPTRGLLESEAQRLGLLQSQRVRFLGSREDVETLYAAMDVSTLCSVTETFPMAVLEAMGSGVAVVATRVGGLPELVVEGLTGRLVPPHDPDALARAWDELRRDRELCTTMGAAGRDRASAEFSAESMGQAYAGLFDRFSAIRNR